MIDFIFIYSKVIISEGCFYFVSSVYFFFIVYGMFNVIYSLKRIKFVIKMN